MCPHRISTLQPQTLPLHKVTRRHQRLHSLGLCIRSTKRGSSSRIRYPQKILALKEEATMDETETVNSGSNFHAGVQPQAGGSSDSHSNLHHCFLLILRAVSKRTILAPRHRYLRHLISTPLAHACPMFKTDTVLLA
jgi:hypothetical protein